MANIEEKVETLITKTIENLGYELYDVIYEKEAQDYYLRIFIDTKGGISLNDCEKVNGAISDMLDEANYIKDQYFLEVSSPGIERKLRKDKHLQANIGKEITCNLYHPITIEQLSKENTTEKQIKTKKLQKSTNLKQIDGILKGFDKEKITVELNVSKENSQIEIERKNIATMKLKYNWKQGGIEEK